ncbi:MAG TPA: ROK family protein, partial [Tepidisphaeraceae bacterium]|nr:ROK family protein [Tepidisphaeraceae bacterium]
TAGGPMDSDAGVVSPLHQPAWHGVPLKAIVERRFGCPFRVDVDTNAAALAECRFGGADPARLLYLTLSTGMGGGFVVDGRVYRGAGGAHPEVGHQVVPACSPRAAAATCACGATGCLEALVSGNGIRRLYDKPAEELAEREWAEVATHLGHGLRNVAAIYAPATIVLGGGVAVGGGQPLLETATRVMRDGLRLVPPPVVKISALGYDTALHGAIALALSAIEG